MGLKLRMKKKVISLLLIVFIMTSIMAVPGFAQTDMDDVPYLPQSGYMLLIEGEGGHIFIDGKEQTVGMPVEITAGNSVDFMADTDDGYALDHWEIIYSEGTLYYTGNVYSSGFNGMYFYTIKAVFVKKDIYKLRFRINISGTDCSYIDYAATCTYNLSGIPFSAYTFPGDLTIDEVYNDFGEKGVRLSEFSQITKNVNYISIDCESGDWIVIRTDKYPDRNLLLGTPHYISSGFSVSDESMVEDKRSVQSLTEQFVGNDYIVFKMTGDLTVTSNLHEMQYTELVLDTDEDKGMIFVSPEATIESTYWWEGTTVDIQAVPQNGFRFAGWEELSGSVINENNRNYNPLRLEIGTESIVIKALFTEAEPQYRPVEVSSDPEGKARILVNGSDSSPQVLEGSRVILGIEPDEYYILDHWEVVQNSTDSSNLVLTRDQHLDDAGFYMPFGTGGVTVSAKLKNRYSEFDVRAVLLKGSSGSSAGAKGKVEYAIEKNSELINDKYCFVQKGDVLNLNVNILDSENYVLKYIKVEEMKNGKYILYKTITSLKECIVIPSWSDWQATIYIEQKTDENARRAIEITAPQYGGTIAASHDDAAVNTSITLTAVPVDGYKLHEWVVKDESGNSIEVSSDNTDELKAYFTMPMSSVSVTAVFDAPENVVAEITSVVLLDGSSGQAVAQGSLDGDVWTIDLPDTMTEDDLELISMGVSGLYLQIVSPEGVKVKQLDGGGNYDGDWSDGTIMCYMPVDKATRFRAYTTTDSKDYTITLKRFIKEPEPEKEYSLTVSVPKGGILLLNRQTAVPGDLITINVQPSDGYMFVNGSLTYTIATAGGETFVITGNSFIMPANDVTVTCRWEKRQASEDPVDNESVSERFWNSLVETAKNNPWWEHADEQYVKGGYPQYW